MGPGGQGSRGPGGQGSRGPFGARSPGGPFGARGPGGPFGARVDLVVNVDEDEIRLGYKKIEIKG